MKFDVFFSASYLSRRGVPIMSFKSSILRPLRSCVLLAFAALVAAAAATTDDRVLYRDGFVTVVSPDGATPAQARMVAKKVMDAWNFDLNLMRWTNPAPIQRPLTVRLISDERMKEERHGDTRAFSTINRFTVKMGLLDDPGVVRTFAHELGHIQASRTMGGLKVPRYFMEGHGQMMNISYSDHLGQDRRSVGANQARVFMKLTPEKTQIVLTDEERGGKEPNMGVIGLYFVEYLRARKGIAGAVPRMGRVFEFVGRGEAYPKAFQHAYGLSLDRTVAELIKYIQTTASNPVARVKGTSFEQYLPQ